MYYIKYTQPKRAGFNIKPIVITERNRIGRKKPVARRKKIVKERVIYNTYI